jgi:hypothetical protein
VTTRTRDADVRDDNNGARARERMEGEGAPARDRNVS